MTVQETMTVPVELSFNLISTLAGRSESDFENVRKYINKGFSYQGGVFWAELTTFHQEVSFPLADTSELSRTIDTIRRLQFYRSLYDKIVLSDLPMNPHDTLYPSPQSTGLEIRVVDPQGNLWKSVHTGESLVMESTDNAGNIQIVPYTDASLNQYKTLIYSVNPDKIDPLYYHLRYNPIDTVAPVSSVRMRDTLVNMSQNISDWFTKRYENWRPYVSYNVVNDVYYMWSQVKTYAPDYFTLETIEDYDTDDVIPQGSRAEVSPSTMFYKLLMDTEWEYPKTDAINNLVSELKQVIPTDTYNLADMADDLVLYGEVPFSRFREVMSNDTLELSGYKELMSDIPALEPLAKLAIGSELKDIEWNIIEYQPPLTFYLNGNNYETQIVPFKSRIFNPIEYFQQSSVDQDVALFGEDTAGGIPKDKLELYIDKLESEDYETQLYDASNYVEEDA